MKGKDQNYLAFSPFTLPKFVLIPHELAKKIFMVATMPSRRDKLRP
jgi:hypothetical protein